MVNFKQFLMTIDLVWNSPGNAMLGWCWATVYDAGPNKTKHWLYFVFVQLLERGEDVQRDPQPRSISDHTDTTSLAKRHFADVIYYETLAMDEFSWTDFQMQAFQLLMRVKQVRMRRSRSHQQSFTTSFNSCALVERGNTPTHPWSELLVI